MNLGEGANFILAEGLKIEFFWHRQVEGANVLSILCTLCFCPCNRPHVSELCDPLYYLKHTFVYFVSEFTQQVLPVVGISFVH